MKRWCLGAAVALTLAHGAWGLDSEKLAGLERDWGTLMQTSEAPALLTLEKGGQQPPGETALRTQTREGITAHNLARALPGKGWAAKAADRLKGPSRGTDPEVALVALAYLGSARALMASEDPNPAMKITLVNQGWDLLTEAVNKGGADSFLPRFLRASVGQALPEFFGKAPTVVADTRALAAWAAAHPGRMGPDLVAQVALMEGNALKKTKDLDGAVAAWHRALALDPDKKGPGKAAAAALELYEE